jgi:AcrR family transcriptional regulator
MDDVKASGTRRRASYAKGLERRKQLLAAASGLLKVSPLDKISLKDIAAEAGIPVGSAYHFYTNANDVFIELAQQFSETLADALSEPYTGECTASWQALFSEAVRRAVRIYRGQPAYAQLIIGSKAPPEIKLADRDSDAKVGRLFEEIISRHFAYTPFPSHDEVFFHSVEIVDLFLTLSVIKHDKITDQMAAEAEIAALAYLREYMPARLPPRQVVASEPTDPSPS